MLWNTNPLTTIIDGSFRPGRFYQPSVLTSPHLTCDTTQMRGTGIVTLYPSIVLALANWDKFGLHWWITTVNIDFTPPGIDGLCKKLVYLTLTLRVGKWLWGKRGRLNIKMPSYQYRISHFISNHFINCGWGGTFHLRDYYCAFQHCPLWLEWGYHLRQS